MTTFDWVYLYASNGEPLSFCLPRVGYMSICFGSCTVILVHRLWLEEAVWITQFSIIYTKLGSKASAWVTLSDRQIDA